MIHDLPVDVPTDVRREIHSLQGDVFYILKVIGLHVVPYWVSNTICEIFGISVDDCLGESLWWSNRLHPDDRFRAQEGLTTLFKDGVLNHTYKFCHADGQYLTVDDRLKVFKYDGRVSYIVGVWTVIDSTSNS